MAIARGVGGGMVGWILFLDFWEVGLEGGWGEGLGDEGLGGCRCVLEKVRCAGQWFFRICGCWLEMAVVVGSSRDVDFCKARCVAVFTGYGRVRG